MSRPSLALVIDEHGWAFDNISSQLDRYLADRYDIHKFYVCDYEKNNWALAHDLFFANKFDHVHFMWREFFFLLLRHPKKILKFLDEYQISIEHFCQRISQAIITTTVYDHLFSTPSELAERISWLGCLDGYSVASPILQTIYEEAWPIKPDGMTEDGVCTEFFRPRNLERFQMTDRPFVIGWCGNSEWGSRYLEDPKGFHSIILPAIEQLKAEGLRIETNFADRSVNYRSFEEMPKFYSEIDVLVCASLVEGTPNPVLEAMSCGVPIVSTDVGIVRMAAGQMQSSFILSERSVEAMKSQIRRLYQDRTLLAQLSTENQKSIEGWDWKYKVEKWIPVLHAARDRNKNTSISQYCTMRQLLEFACSDATKGSKRQERSNEDFVTGIDSAEFEKLKQEVVRIAKGLSDQKEFFSKRLELERNKIQTLRRNLQNRIRELDIDQKYLAREIESMRKHTLAEPPITASLLTQGTGAEQCLASEKSSQGRQPGVTSSQEANRESRKKPDVPKPPPKKELDCDPVRFICMLNRTGSSWLCEMLNRAGLDYHAGEWFNGENQWMSFPPTDVGRAEQWQRLLAAHKENGKRIVVKCSIGQMRAFQSLIGQQLIRKNRYIFLLRNDLVNQAISQFLLQLRLREKVSHIDLQIIDPERVMQLVNKFEFNNNLWRDWLKRNAEHVAEVHYEEMVENPRSIVEKVISHFDGAEAVAKIDPHVEWATVRQKNNVPFLDQWRRAIQLFQQGDPHWKEPLNETVSGELFLS